MAKVEFHSTASIRRYGWFTLVSAAIILLLVIFQLPGELPSRAEFDHTAGIFSGLTVNSGKRSGWTISLADGSAHRIYELVDFDSRAFLEKVEEGDVLQLYLMDGEVYGIYDRRGEPVHSLERSWEGQRRNSMFGFLLAGIFAVGGLVMVLGASAQQRKEEAARHRQSGSGENN